MPRYLFLILLRACARRGPGAEGEEERRAHVGPRRVVSCSSAISGRRWRVSRSYWTLCAVGRRLRFCPVCHDLMYPREDKERRVLVYFCK